MASLHRIWVEQSECMEKFDFLENETNDVLNDQSESLESFNKLAAEGRVRQKVSNFDWNEKENLFDEEEADSEADKLSKNSRSGF